MGQAYVFSLLTQSLDLCFRLEVILEMFLSTTRVLLDNAEVFRLKLCGHVRFNVEENSPKDSEPYSVLEWTSCSSYDWVFCKKI